MFAVPAFTSCAASRARERRDGLAVCVEHARGAAGNHQPRGANRRRQMRRQRIGIDVEQLTVARGTDAGDDRHIAARQQIRQQLRRRRCGPARRQVRGPRTSPATLTIGAARFTVATVASAPVSPTGLPPARRTAATSRVLIAPASTDDHDVECRRVGDAKAVDLLLGNARSRQRGVDLLAATVHDDERGARRQARDAFGHALEIVRLLEKLATELQDETFLHSRPVRSSRPSSMLRFCTADPAAPLTRLSMTATSTMRPPSASTFQPMSQKLVCATCLISGSAAAGQAHERRIRVRGCERRRRPAPRSCLASSDA